MRYRAFLSYSHHDAAWARWLLRRLEGYRVPARLVGTPGLDGPVPARLGAMFRDRDELPSAGDLSDTIRGALAESATLVVVCSPSAAQSRWVDAEVEAFRASGRGARVLCFVVDGDPASREPGRECFPPSLLRADGDGVAREPLAADARPEGDGRERAFLKLVAGLLGVGYDALARRETQRRNRRLAWIAAASLAGMAVTSTLAVSAYVARNDAQRRQAQAEDIVGFMLGDLREKLATVGRLDLMRAVDAKATGYFATLQPRDLSDRALEEQARSLTGIGQVRLEEGDHDAALAAFREAHARSTALRERAPADGQRLFDLAQAEYWIGLVALQQGRRDDAATWFGRYRDSALRLAAMDRSNFDWQKEVAYAQHNLAVLDEDRGRHDQARAAMREVLALYRGWTQQQPRDTALRFEAANVASWLGTLAMHQGQLPQAEALFTEQLRGLARNRAQEPRDANWRDREVAALLLLAEPLAQRGRRAEASARLREATAQAEALAAQDPSNRKWQVTVGFCRLWQAQLEADPATAEAGAHAAEALLASAHAAEPRNEQVRRGLATTRNLLAQLALARGDAAAARRELAQARTLLRADATLQADRGPDITFANTRLLEGEASRLAGNPAAAAAAWNDTWQLLTADDAEPLPFARLDPLVRALHRLGRDEQARPHRQRLADAGYQPMHPWPDTAVVAQR